jgi:hypothetical protein
MSGYPVPALLPPDPEDFGMYYFTSLLAPTLIDTRLPNPAANADTINGFGTIESAGFTRIDLASYNISNIYHCYSPKEAEAADLSRTIMAHGTAIQGKTVMGWNVMGLVSAIGGVKLPNPDVNLPRYRCALTWRIQGQPVA